MSTMLPDRALILLSLALVCGSLIWSHVAGEYLAGKLNTTSHQIKQIISVTATIALLLLIVFPQISFFSNLAIRSEARSYAADWDRQDAQLKAAKQSGDMDVTVPQVGDFQSRIGKGPGNLHLRTDPAFWINRVTAGYYGLSSVRTTYDMTISR